jgi:hypothetical protein
VPLSKEMVRGRGINISLPPMGIYAILYLITEHVKSAQVPDAFNLWDYLFRKRLKFNYIFTGSLQ